MIFIFDPLKLAAKQGMPVYQSSYPHHSFLNKRCFGVTSVDLLDGVGEGTGVTACMGVGVAEGDADGLVEGDGSGVATGIDVRDGVETAEGTCTGGSLLGVSLRFGKRSLMK